VPYSRSQLFELSKKVGRSWRTLQYWAAQGCDLNDPAGVDREPAEEEREIVTLVRDKIGPVAAFKIAIVVNRLPKTRSGKTLRGTMKKIADDDAWTMPATIDDSAVLSEIAAALQRRLSRGG